MVNKIEKCEDCEDCSKEYNWCYNPKCQGIVIPNKKPPKRCNKFNRLKSTNMKKKFIIKKSTKYKENELYVEDLWKTVGKTCGTDDRGRYAVKKNGRLIPDNSGEGNGWWMVFDTEEEANQFIARHNGSNE